LRTSSLGDAGHRLGTLPADEIADVILKRIIVESAGA
jgi:hypothetical protein